MVEPLSNERLNMTRMPVLHNPLLLGFDRFEQMIDRASKNSNESYPPYNIEKIGEFDLRITIAVAGFKLDNLDVSLHNEQLHIKGHTPEETQKEFIHRGIGTRQFQRIFILADGIEVVDASIDNGLLQIDLTRPKPNNTTKKITIRTR